MFRCTWPAGTHEDHVSKPNRANVRPGVVRSDPEARLVDRREVRRWSTSKLGAGMRPKGISMTPLGVRALPSRYAGQAFSR